MLGTWEGGRVEIDEAPGVGDYFVVLSRFRARVRSSGRDFEVKLSHVWKLAGGRVVWFCSYVDTRLCSERSRPDSSSPYESPRSAPRCR